MNCEETRVMLDDHVDGDLGPDAADRVARHLEGCAACRQERQEIETLVAEASDLPGAIEPPRDLWSDIEARLDDAPKIVAMRQPVKAVRRTSWTRMLIAASLLIAATGTGYVVLNLGSGAVAPPDAGRTDVASRPSAPAIVTTSGPTMHLAEQAILDAKQQLRVALEEHRPRLSPGTQNEVDANMRIIEEAIDKIQQAVRDDPANPELNRMLIAAHQRELKMLQRLTQLAVMKTREP